MQAVKKPEELGELFARTILVSVIFLVPGLLLAVASAWTLGLMLFYLPRPPWVLPPQVALVAGVAAHGLFIAFMTALMRPPMRRLPLWLAASAREAARGTLPMAALFGAALVVTWKIPLVAPVLWALGTVFAVPERLNRSGWIGGMRLFDPLPTPVLHRIAVMTPSFILLSLMTLLFANAGDSWGIMDGGAFMIPLLGATTFWGCFSCALFSAQFAADLDAI